MVKLNEIEIAALKKYRLSTEEAAPYETIKGLDLLNDDLMKRIFDKKLQEKLNTDKQNVIGSMLVKRYAFIAALVLYSMSVFDKGINSSIENVSLQTDENDPLWLPSFNFGNLEVTTPGSDRADWRAEVVQTLFLKNITKVVSSISSQTKIAKSVLWENIAVYVFWMYETLLKDESLTNEQYSKVQEDFHYVVIDAPPALFGAKSRNPLSQFYQPKQNDIRTRKTCCLFYVTSTNGDRCTTCPIECSKTFIKEDAKNGS
ncbi:IucA/IucC family C-terminal-domain containing protein [uncultured Metabacillus sp.]|uniref:IucA/IucC family C-terminal-domain containing protein n=1 Tax=uncultured Metabacillus sp. TaxID=2860135 RepID=UPI00261E09B6|nr:IucA/IucC family C-terminal-domain containing protein [uncultured Metabacillus sp.]